MRDVRVGLALSPDDGLRAAATPLFVAGEVEAIEWTLDLGWRRPPPDWVVALLDAYAVEGRLYGHGVEYSPTSARPAQAARDWIAQAREDVGRRRYQHVTEHWGVARAGSLAAGAPLPLPASEATVAVTTDALRALAAALDVPVGLENLALAFSDVDVDAQPAMLSRVLDAVDGVLLLDVHNLWCQAINFDRDVRELAARYPLARVRELHVAGGRWSTSESIDTRPFRRDTHDAPVPDEVLDLLGWIIPRCPALEAVFVEWIPGSLAAASAQEQWRAQWPTFRAAVHAAARAPIVALPTVAAPALPSHTTTQLAAYQDALVTLLAGTPVAEARTRLLADPASEPFRDEIVRFTPRALAVASELIARWGVELG